MKILGIIGLVLVIVVGAVIVLVSIKREEKYKEKFTVNPGTALKVFNVNGGIEVASNDQDYVEVEAVKKRNLFNYLFKVPEIDVKTGNELVVRTVNSSTGCFAVPVNYKITVPKGVKVQYLETSTGGIKVAGVSGDVEAKTSTGSIQIKDVDGFVRAQTSTGAIEIAKVKGVYGAQTSTGSITAEVAAIKENLDIKASTGGITVLISPSVVAQLEASTSTGRVSYEGLSIVTSESTNKKLVGKLGENGDGKINVRTSTGSITLKKL